MKKLAPPGRKGSVKVGAFKGENLAEEINDQDMARRNEEQQKKQVEADTEAANQEATRLADEKEQALEKQKQAEAEAQRKAEKQQRLEDERKAQEKADRLAQEKKAQRLLELEQEKQRQAEAEQAALEQALEEQRQQAEAAAQQEQKAQRRLALEQEKQRQAEAEHEAAALEEQRLQAEATAQQEQKAQRRLALEQEKQRQAEAEHEAAALEEQRLQAEATAQQEQKVQRKLALEQERQRQAEEQQRLEEEAAAEKVRAREQRRQELEEQRRLAEEAENERIQREQQQEEEELLKLRDAEIARRRALKEQREREAEEERIREQELIDKENQELEAERLRLAEQARLAAEQATETESAEAAAKRKRLEEQRKKRAMFLNDMDSFSTNFEAKTQLAEEQRRETTAMQDQILVEQMAKKSDQFVAKKVEIKEEEVVRRPAAVVVEEEVLPTPPVQTAPVSAVTHKDSAKNKEVLNSLSSSLFANNDEAVAHPVSPTAEMAAADTTAASEPAVEEFRMPSRIGTGKVKSPKGGASSTNTVNAASTPSRAAKEEEVVEPIMRREDSSYMAAYMASSLAASAAAVPVKGVKKSGSKEALSAAAAGGSSSPSKGEAPIAENEDDEEEGTGDLANLSNILTREERRAMSSQQKANWRAKQADLTTRRKDFHGVVTYTFDGIFSWQMYGSAEASDENGNPYTEYLMRCQWGTTFENLQPWIVAHRYKEFDTLDQKLKKSFPSFEKNMPSLPKKDLFRYLDTNVIAQRRTILEDYMSKIVVSMPTILRSEIMNEFLNISERIASIRLKLTLINTTNVNISGSNASKKNNARIAAEETVSPEVIPYGTTNELHRPVEIRDPLSAGSNSNTASKTTSSTGHSNSMFGDEDPFGLGAVTKTTTTKKLFQKAPAVQNDEEEEERLVLYLTLDSAEAAKEAQNSPSLDDNALGQLEEDIKGLYIMLRKTPVEQLLPKKSKFRTHLLSVCHRWPRLRATCVVGMGVDFSLIPRAMQAEEDLQRYIGEFRSIEAATGV